MSRGLLGMLYLQAFDLDGLDYARLAGLAARPDRLDPRGQYPLFAAARIYAEHRTRARPGDAGAHPRTIPPRPESALAVAHAALLAKHRLKDLPLARRYAAAIDRHTTAVDVPLWARQMEIFIWRT